jgi:hypothetical protein
MDDEGRQPTEPEDPDNKTPAEYADFWAEIFADSWERYTPGSFWDFQPYYIEMVVEKVDLKTLFKPICDKYRVRVANASG